MLGDDVLPQPYRFVNKVVQRCVERALEEITFHMSRSPVLERQYIPPKLTKRIDQQTLGMTVSPELLERPPTVAGASVYPPELGIVATEAQRLYDQGQIQKKRTLRQRGIDSSPTSPISTPLPPDATSSGTNVHDISNCGDSSSTIPAVAAAAAVPTLPYPPLTPTITSSCVHPSTAIFGLSDGSVQIVNTETQSMLMKTPVLFENLSVNVLYPDSAAVSSAVIAACRQVATGIGAAAAAAADLDGVPRSQSVSVTSPPQSSPGKARGSSRNNSRRETPPLSNSFRRDSSPGSPTSGGGGANASTNPYLPSSSSSSGSILPPSPGAGVVSVTGGTPLHAQNLELFAAATAVDGVVVFAVDLDGLAEGPKLQKRGPLTGANAAAITNGGGGIRDAEIKVIKDTLLESIAKKSQPIAEGKRKSGSLSAASGGGGGGGPRPSIGAASNGISPQIASSLGSGGMMKVANPKRNLTGSAGGLRDAAPPIELGVVAQIPHQLLSVAVTAFYEQHPSLNPLSTYHAALQRARAVAAAVASPPAAATGISTAASGRRPSAEIGVTPRRVKSTQNLGGGSSTLAAPSKSGGGGLANQTADVNLSIPTSTDGDASASFTPIPPPPATPGSFVSSIKLSPDGTFLAVGMDEDATVVIVELFTTTKGDLFTRVPHVIEVIASPSQLFEAVGGMSTPRAQYHFGSLSAPLSTPSHSPHPNPVLEHLRQEVKAVHTANVLEGLVADPSASSGPYNNNNTSSTTTKAANNTTTIANVEKERQSKIKQINDECEAAVVSFDPLATVCGWVFVGWTGTNAMTRVSLKNTAAVVRSVVFGSYETAMKAQESATADVCLGLVVEEAARVVAASRAELVSQLHTKVNHQLNRAALGPNGTGSFTGQGGPMSQDALNGGTPGSKKGGGGGNSSSGTNVDKPPRARGGGAANNNASTSGFSASNEAIVGPFPTSSEVSSAAVSSSSVATVSVAHAVAASMGVLPAAGSALIHPISGTSMVLGLQSNMGNGGRCSSSGGGTAATQGGGGPPPLPATGGVQRRDGGASSTTPTSSSSSPTASRSIIPAMVPQNSRCDLLLPATLITTTASQDHSLLALCCINGITAVYDTNALNFKHYFNEMPHRVVNKCQKLVAPLQATFQGNRTLSVATVTYGASYRSFVTVFALQPGLAFPPSDNSRLVQEHKKQVAGRSAVVVRDENEASLSGRSGVSKVDTHGLLSLDSPTRTRHQQVADQNEFLSTTGKQAIRLDATTTRSTAGLNGTSNSNVTANNEGGGDGRALTTLIPTTENHHSSLTPASSCGERLCRVQYLDSLEFAVPLGDHLPLLLVKACGGQLLLIDMTEGELVCILNGTGTTSAPSTNNAAASTTSATTAASDFKGEKKKNNPSSTSKKASSTTMWSKRLSSVSNQLEMGGGDRWGYGGIAAAVRSALTLGGSGWSNQTIETSVQQYIRHILSGDIASLGSRGVAGGASSTASTVSLSGGGGDYGSVLQSLGIPAFPTHTSSSAAYTDPITCSSVLQRPHLANQITNAILSRCTPPTSACFRNFHGLSVLFSEYPQLQRIFGNSSNSAQQIGPLLFVIPHSSRSSPLTPERLGAAQQTVQFFERQYYLGGATSCVGITEGDQQRTALSSAGSNANGGGVISLGALTGGGGVGSPHSSGGALAVASLMSRAEHRSPAPLSKQTTIDTLGAAPPTPYSTVEPSIKSATRTGGRGGTMSGTGAAVTHLLPPGASPSPSGCLSDQRSGQHHSLQHASPSSISRHVVVPPQAIPAAETSFKQATLDSLEAQERGRAMRKQQFEATWDRLKASTPAATKAAASGPSQQQQQKQKVASTTSKRRM